MRRSAAGTDEFALADVRLHNTVMEISGNRLARAIVASIHDKARATLRYRGAPAASQAMYDHITGAWARRRPAKD